MHINDLPFELLSKILAQTAAINRQDGVRYIYGICEVPTSATAENNANSPRRQIHILNGRRPSLPTHGPLAHAGVTKYEKYIKGYNHMQNIDAATEIRQVCRLWHYWTIRHFFSEIRVEKRPGPEKWADVTHNRNAYNAYELIDSNRLRGAYVYRDPYFSLYQTHHLVSAHSLLASNLQSLWFSGFYGHELVQTIADVVSRCTNLRKVTLPWTALRYFSADDWCKLLRSDSENPLRSLELLCLDNGSVLSHHKSNLVDLKALEDPKVSFSKLKRLKVYGDTTFMPVTDKDIFNIAKTVESLEEFHLTCNSSVSINSVVAIIKASQHSLKLLEHSPRSHAGFDHPHPGYHEEGEHLCDLLINCTELETLSVSLPFVCSHLFSDRHVKWSADCQVRAAHLCPEAVRRTRRAGGALGDLLHQSRELMLTRNQQLRQKGAVPLTIEFFYADCIFDPHLDTVHGHFEPGHVASNGSWPRVKAPSVKGPYGSTGVYKGEDGVFDQIEEVEYLRGIDSGWVRVE